jgi:membrane-bound ClpP family serine protease
MRPKAGDDSPFAELQHYVGQVGRALTDLRPSGTVEIDGNPVDAMTDEGFLPAGIPVRAIGIKQAQLLVRRYET